MNLKSSIFITMALTSPAIMAGGLGCLKPGARPAPVNAMAPGIAAHAQQAPSRAAARPDFYGVVLASATNPAGPPAICSFRAGYSPAPQNVMTLSAMSGCSGTYADGAFRYMEYNTNSSGNITSVNWTSVDIDSRKVTSSLSQDYAIGVCMDMTYDATTGTVYGISALSDVLVTVDTATGEATPLASTLPFYTISADAAGQLYGIALDTETREGVLYTINKMTGNALKVGSTGVKMLTDASGSIAYFQTASFSSADGKLYWVVANSDGASALYRVDVATGRGSYLAPMPDNEDMVALFDVPAPAAPGAPAAVTDVTATAAADGSLSVEIAFKAPATCADGSALASISSIDIYRGTGEEPVKSLASPAPGAPCSWTDTDAEAGFNAYRIVAVNDEGESIAVYASAYCGEDFPEAPDNLRITVNADGYPTLTWDAPVTGLNGLPVDPAKLTYKVLRDVTGRLPETIAEGVAGTTFTDTGLDITAQAYPYYYVVATSSAGDGRQSLPAGTYTGPAYPLPLTETFKDCTLHTSPWILQSLALGGAWELNYVSTFPGSGPYVEDGMLIFIGFRSVEGAQARISTPLLTFENAVAPELRFHFYYLDMSSEDLRFNDYMEVEASVDGGEFTPVDGGRFVQHDADSRWTECVVPLHAYAGKKKVAIGFHGYSGGGFNLLLDNIRITDSDNNAIGDVEADTSALPVEYFNLQGMRVDAGALTPGIYIRRQGTKTTKIAVR